MIYVEKGNIGYTIEEKELGEYKSQGFQIPQPNFDKMTIDELKIFADGKSIDLSGLTKKEDILAKIKESL